VTRVGVLGATGLVGSEYVKRLLAHPQFELAAVCASDESAGKVFGGLPLRRVDDLLANPDVEMVFSCLSGPNVTETEEAFARVGVHVVSNTSACRRLPHVPVIIPEVNPHHLELVEKQPWSGSIVCKPNCAVQSYVIPLAPLKRFGIKQLIVTTLQALSGAGRNAEAHLSPYIPGEEEKCEWEPRKILDLPELPISVQCNRVPIPHGHTACVSVAFEEKPTLEQIREAWGELTYLEGEDRPRPDLDLGDGMEVTIGRLRPCHVLDYRFVALSHNLVRGAAGGGILLAEKLYESLHCTTSQ
jgi:aspartate-semialdehyde dehydrogenase